MRLTSTMKSEVLLGKMTRGEVVGEGIELPVQEVIGGGDGEGVAEDGGSTVGRRAQLDDLGAEGDGAFVAIGGAMVQGDLCCHSFLVRVDLDGSPDVRDVRAWVRGPRERVRRIRCGLCFEGYRTKTRVRVDGSRVTGAGCSR